MVKITDYQLRKTEEGREFFVLILQSGIEIIKSQNGGLYATAKKASIPSTFNEEACKMLIGQELPGAIQKVECEAYVYYLPETGEAITRTHRYEYFPESNTVDTFLEKLEKPKNYQLNGQLVNA